MISAPLSPIPSISITDASFEYSQLSKGNGDLPPAYSLTDENSQLVTVDEDDFRPTYLAPPPNVVPIRPPGLRLASSALPTDKKGLEKARFDDLLRSSRDRGAAKRPMNDLRREVGIKVHHAKQEERRATFLAKIRALPSPTATMTPATPPESPAEFHFSLPSPGLVSPLAMFETHESKGETWVERIDYQLTAKADLLSPTSPPVVRIGAFRLDSTTLPMSARRSSARLLPIGGGAAAHGRGMAIVPPRRTSSIPSSAAPSLHQITARIASTGPRVTVTAPARPRPALPSFLLERTKCAPSAAAAPPPAIVVSAHTRPKSADLGSFMAVENARVQKGTEMMMKLKRRSSAPAAKPDAKAERAHGGF